MAAIVLSNVSSQNLAQSVAVGKSAPAQSAPNLRQSATLQPDTVRLSAAAQAKLMHRQGQSLAVIAASLGTNVAAVDAYLGIKATAPTPAPATAEPKQPVATATPAASPAKPAPNYPI